jgi:Zn-dependent peptidase ImmA (M78 family)/DNA-binding XRE family transcriptional regulator
MTTAAINHEILVWARERAALGEVALAKKLNVALDKLIAWERGISLPTFAQAKSYAEKTHIPFGYLFLRQLPVDVLPLPDLRTVGSSTRANLSAELKDTLKEVMARQNWYSEYQQQGEAEPCPFVGKMQGCTDVSHIVADMKAALEMGFPLTGNWEDYLRELVNRIESLGILVMRNSHVGNNIHRPLSVQEFRGFAIADKFAPVIFINTADAPTARLFTLIHELAHIWLGQSGISDAEPQADHTTEALCNAIAAEFLVPEKDFKVYWNPSLAWQQNIAPLTKYFRVSGVVIARRALTLGYIDLTSYQRFVEQLQREHRERETSGAPNYWLVHKTHISARFAQTVASEALSGRVLLRDAAQLLAVKPAKVAVFAKSLSV